MIINPYIFQTQGGNEGGSVPTSNLRMHLKSDSNVSYNVSNLVNIWGDQTAYLNNATQSSDARKPTYSALDTTMNNLPSLTFSGGSDDVMYVSPNSSLDFSANGFSMYMVVYVQSFSSSYSTLIAHTNDATMTQGWGIYYYNGELTYFINNYNNVSNYVRIPNLNVNQKTLVKFTWDKNTIFGSYRQNGSTTQGTKAYSGAYTNPNSYNLSLMNLPGGNTVYDISGKFGEVLLYNGVLSVQDDLNLQNYLKSKYGIA